MILQLDRNGAEKSQQTDSRWHVAHTKYRILWGIVDNYILKKLITHRAQTRRPAWKSHFATTVDDLIRTHISTLLESSLLKPGSTMGACLSFVVSCMRTAKYSKAIRDAATRTFSKFLLISPDLAERGASFLFTVLCCDEEPHMREYLLASGVDLLHRFPTMMENYALFIYKMANDEDFSVRLTAILYLTHLLCKDILKPRGCLSDVALSMLPSKSFTESGCGGREVAAAACNLFNELSKK
ncbi:hypothetical protein ANCDUO_14720, partial [Ancylostoma duodenale]